VNGSSEKSEKPFPAGKTSFPALFRDSDNLLILFLIIMLMREKANQSLVFALLFVLIQD
jgi:hypothetical protein